MQALTGGLTSCNKSFQEINKLVSGVGCPRWHPAEIFLVGKFLLGGWAVVAAEYARARVSWVHRIALASEGPWVAPANSM